MKPFKALSSSRSKLELEWDCLLSVYDKLNVVGRIFAKKRINDICKRLKVKR